MCIGVIEMPYDGDGPLVPFRMLVRLEVPLHKLDKPVRLDGNLRKWSDKYLMPATYELDHGHELGPVWIAWHESGLYVACRVRGKRRRPECRPRWFWKSDNLRIMTDTRDTKDAHRATRFCQQFYFMPCGGGPYSEEPAAAAARIHRARQDAPLPEEGTIEVAAGLYGDGYDLEGRIPDEVLVGFEPVPGRRIGLYYMLEDRELGQQYLTVGDDLYWYVDPSVWATAVLTE
jgi:hypothetical protein